MSITIEKKSEPGVTYATGRSVLVWYDYTAGKSLPWPEKVRQAIT
jgi:acyl-CoA thioesterase FadM